MLATQIRVQPSDAEDRPVVWEGHGGQSRTIVLRSRFVWRGLWDRSASRFPEKIGDEDEGRGRFGGLVRSVRSRSRLLFMETPEPTIIHEEAQCT